MQNSSKIGRPRGKPIVIECFGMRMIGIGKEVFNIGDENLVEMSQRDIYEETRLEDNEYGEAIESQGHNYLYSSPGGDTSDFHFEFTDTPKDEHIESEHENGHTDDLSLDYQTCNYNYYSEYVDYIREDIEL